MKLNNIKNQFIVALISMSNMVFIACNSNSNKSNSSNSGNSESNSVSGCFFRQFVNIVD